MVVFGLNRHLTLKLWASKGMAVEPLGSEVRVKGKWIQWRDEGGDITMC